MCSSDLESALGGTLGLVKTGDKIKLDVPARKLELLVSDAELEARRAAWKKPRARKEDGRGYRKLFMNEVTQADRGCDFEFLIPPLTMKVPRTAR